MNDNTNTGTIFICTKNVMAFSASVNRLRMFCSQKKNKVLRHFFILFFSFFFQPLWQLWSRSCRSGTTCPFTPAMTRHGASTCSCLRAGKRRSWSPISPGSSFMPRNRATPFTSPRKTWWRSHFPRTSFIGLTQTDFFFHFRSTSTVKNESEMNSRDFFHFPPVWESFFHGKIFFLKKISFFRSEFGGHPRSLRIESRVRVQESVWWWFSLILFALCPPPPPGGCWRR